jgi:hypothetical protein
MGHAVMPLVFEDARGTPTVPEEPQQDMRARSSLLQILARPSRVLPKALDA